ncbi:hypothetical protein ACQJBY_067613 [Aegilops geniculata]
MAPAVCRAGIVAALRSVKLGGAAIGLVITASHNPVGDNGVKIVDADGGMMSQAWEPFSDALANAPTPDALLQLVLQFAKDEGITLGGAHSAQVLLARDTRPTGEYLLDVATKGINAVVGSVALDMGILTTPQLHWMVRNKNRGLKASEADYFTQITESFRHLLELTPDDKGIDELNEKLIVDGANGIGGLKLEQIKPNLARLDIIVRNSGKEGEGILNERCGADFVQKEKVLPLGFGPNDVGVRCASFDGDADRLVYFHVTSPSKTSVDLVDGDKILSLFVLFIREQLDIINGKDNKGLLPTRFGVVQTAYANGASTEFLKNLGLEVVFTSTGVKYLHKKALEYDIGVYFEANGHGTVLFNDEFVSRLESLTARLSEAAERKVCQPSGLQELIDKEVVNHSHWRCFVRPSGTEDVVRVYAEASTVEAADSLAKSVAQHVERILGFC